MLDEGSAGVRKAAADILSQMDDLSELTESQRSKLGKRQPVCSENTSKSADSTKKQSMSPSRISVDQKPVSTLKKSTTIEKHSFSSKPAADSKHTSLASAPDQTSKAKVCDLFSDKYPLLFDKDWNKRLAFIQENKEKLREEGISNIILFLIGSKETNLTVLKEMMGILVSFDDLSEISSDLCYYLNSKITESKLKDSIVELFRKIDGVVAIQSILQNIEQNKVGKKFVCLLDVLSSIVTKKNEHIDRFLEKTKVFGMQEKKALSDFTARYKSLENDTPSSLVSVSNTTASLVAKPPLLLSNANESKRNDIFGSARNDPCETGIKRGSVSECHTYEDESKKSLNIKIFKENTDFTGPLANIFTSEFLGVFQKDPFIAVGMLEKIDICRFASAIILLYCQFSLPSPYFNSLILHLISRRFILNDNDAHILVSFLLNHSMDSEIDLMDRIYPATKLYRALRTFPGDLSLNAIFNLVRKYKDVDGLNLRDIEAAVKNNDDFIAFSFNIDRIVILKNELKTKIDQSTGHVNMPCQSMTAHVASNGEVLPDNSTMCSSAMLSNGSMDRPNIDSNQQRLIEEKLNYQNLMKDEDDLDDLEESIIIEKSLVEESSHYSLGDGIDSPHLSASVVKAPSVADRDSLLAEDYGKPRTSNLDKSNQGNDFNVPSSKIIEADLSYEIERSLENISISTTPMKKKRNLSEIENVLNKLSSENSSASVEGLHRLAGIIVDAPSTISFSSNTVISSILIQIMTRYQDVDYRNIALSVLLKFTQNTTLCSCLRFETLKSVHVDLVPLVKDQNVIADILINLCLNCELQVLRVYFDLLEDSNEILMKLIWRHSKKVKYTSVETAATVIKIVDVFFEEKRSFLGNADNIVIKVCLLHLKECVAAFSDNLRQFGISKITERIISLLLSGKDFNVDEARSIFKGKN
ncbi:uncharacterized protein VICG_02045 [Vittaforma corneae ATCC 50505]|uniref:Uncharacterized protein n=1 Tax=Vittaforma corneae (strain ATCC 50505) TaxID=993615 RepID=L2GK66_VITCO|nr:uncharacterized protein VICG_02045 [Vittaforma corneae ATCC 50505]ELA40905.1 hypothetical protein VICG_02045 [Vittaforma corneae ATCC 50505]